MVHSVMAALRSLVLPYGATTGERIELDGITGEVRIYDASNHLLISIDGEHGFVIYDTTGAVRAELAVPTSAIYSYLLLYSAKPLETSPGYVSVSDTGTRNRMIVRPGERNNSGCLELGLYSVGEDNVRPSSFAAVAITLDDPASPRPTIDLTGYGASAEQYQPHTIVYDLYYGTPGANVGMPTKLGSYPRGVVGYQHLATNDAAVAAGNNTDMSVTFTADVTRLYVVHFHSRVTFGTAAATYTIHLRDGAAGANLSTLQRYPPALTPAGSLTSDIDASVPYIPASSGSKTLVVRNGTGSGGTITLQGAGAGEPRDLWVEDIGLQ